MNGQSIHWGVPYAGYGNAAYAFPNQVNEFHYPVKGAQAYDLISPSANELVEQMLGNDVPLLSPAMARTFPTAFLMTCFGVFAVPMAIVLHMGGDPTVMQFVAHYHKVVLILPAIFILAYIVHMRSRGQPNRIVITVTLILSCIVLLILGETYMVTAYQKVPLLASTDCAVLQEKYSIQQEWENARGFYATCMSEKTTTDKISFAAAVAAYRIEDCDGYATQLKTHPVWAYLAGLEENYRCAGWCQEEQPMWTKEHTFDACSAVAAQILQDKVVWSMQQVILYTLFTLMVISVILISTHSLLAKLHIYW